MTPVNRIDHKVVWNLRLFMHGLKIESRQNCDLWLGDDHKLLLLQGTINTRKSYASMTEFHLIKPLM